MKTAKLMLLALLPTSVWAKPVVVEVKSVTAEGVGASIGTLQISEAKKGGIRIEPHLKGLPPGERGFHIHELASCAPGQKDGKVVAAGGAGGHLDTKKTGKHAGPKGSGHEGDLPALEVDKKGVASKPVVARNLTLAAIRGHAVVIHSGGDNYADMPQPLGGGGPRVACGVIPN